jgi:hypothetical protein
MDFAELLKKTWQITWRHKGLWILGILASCAGSGVVGGRFLSGLWEYNSQDGGFLRFPPIQSLLFNSDIPEDVAIIGIIAIIALALLLSLFFTVVSVLGRTGLFAGFDIGDRGGDLSLGVAISQGANYFFRVLGIELLIGLVSALGMGVFALAPLAMATPTLRGGMICIVPIFCLLVPSFLLAGLFAILAQIAVVTEDLPISAAFLRAWEVAKSNFGSMIILALILAVGGVLLMVILSLPVAGILLPAILGVATNDQSIITTTTLASSLCIIGYTPFLFLVYSVMQTFITGAWTLAYRRFSGAKLTTTNA